MNVFDRIHSVWLQLWPSIKERLKDVKFWIVSAMLAVSLAGVAMLKETSGWHHICSALLVATAVYVLDRLFHWIGRFQIHWRLHRFFSVGDGRSVAIFVPEYKNTLGSEDLVSPSPADRIQDLSPKNWGDSVALPRFNPDQHIAERIGGMKSVAAFEDLSAAADVSSVVTRAGASSSDLPLIRSHTDMSIFAGERWTAFAVGMFTNWLTKAAYDRMSSDFYSSMFALCHFTQEGRAWSAIYLRGPRDASPDWKCWTVHAQPRWPTERDRGNEYAIIAKIKDPTGRRVVFIVAGITARGTKLAGTYLRERWLELYRHSPDGEIGRIKDRPFAAVLKIERTADDKDRVELDHAFVGDERIHPTDLSDRPLRDSSAAPRGRELATSLMETSSIGNVNEPGLDSKGASDGAKLPEEKSDKNSASSVEAKSEPQGPVAP